MQSQGDRSEAKVCEPAAILDLTLETLAIPSLLRFLSRAPVQFMELPERGAKRHDLHEIPPACPPRLRYGSLDFIAADVCQDGMRDHLEAIRIRHAQGPPRPGAPPRAVRDRSPRAPPGAQRARTRDRRATPDAA